jgi:broad specificity phosphatase PhoE
VSSARAPTIEVILVRHATTAWTTRRFCGISDPPLNAEGRLRAQALARELATTVPAVARIVSSPRRRARQTAQAIADLVADGAVQLDERWAETDFGRAEGRTFDEVEARDPELAATLLRGETTIDWPGGEPAAALAERVAMAWTELTRGPGPVVVVSHAGPLRIALGLADAVPSAAVALPEPGAIVRRMLVRSIPSGSEVVLPSRP